MSDLPPGAGWSSGEGSMAASGPRSRLTSPVEILPEGAGSPVQLTRAQLAARKRRDTLAGRPRPLYEHWCLSMREALSGHWATEHVDRRVFAPNIAHLHDRGLTDDQIRELITQFAAEVSSGRLNVDHKVPWHVFMRAWPRLQSAGVGLQQDKTLSAEAWTRRSPEV